MYARDFMVSETLINHFDNLMSDYMLRYRKETTNETIVEPVEVSLEDAYTELDNFPTIKDDETSWLDFIVNDSDIQLIRFGQDLWYVDIPIIEDNEFVRSLNTEVDTKTVKDALEKFSNGDDPASLFPNLMSIQHKQTDDYHTLPREQRSSAIRSEYAEEIACKCGSQNFDVERTSKEHIMLKCVKCSTLHSLEVDFSEDRDGGEPVITFIEPE